VPIRRGLRARRGLAGGPDKHWMPGPRGSSGTYRAHGGRRRRPRHGSHVRRARPGRPPSRPRRARRSPGGRGRRDRRPLRGRKVRALARQSLHGSARRSLGDTMSHRSRPGHCARCRPDRFDRGLRLGPRSRARLLPGVQPRALPGLGLRSLRALHRRFGVGLGRRSRRERKLGRRQWGHRLRGQGRCRSVRRGQRRLGRHGALESHGDRIGARRLDGRRRHGR
jgi:hypothetical protein